MTTREFVDRIADSNERYPDAIFDARGEVNTCVNPYSYHIFKKNRHLYDGVDGLFVDGMTMCLFIRILYGKKIRRLSFDMSGMAVDFFSRLNDMENRESVYFIGSKENEIMETVYQISTAYPEINIAGWRNGYFSDDDDRNSAIKAIMDSGADFAVVGMGAPLQEQFAIELRNSGFKGTVFTCGGFLHQTTRRINYYPAWVNRLNLRAFYRLFHEKGMLKRLYYVLLQFPVVFTLDRLKN